MRFRALGGAQRHALLGEPMSTTSVDERAIADLRGHLAGNVILPGDDDYDSARTIFNAMIDRRPKVIAQCDTAQDVATAIRFARDLGLEISVRGGGHGVAGTAITDGGLVIDLRRMHDVTVDADAGTARVPGGSVVADLDQATQPYGLATTGGRVSTTGLGGFTLGGGSGWLERKFGLASDNLLSVDLVTADGEHVTATERENSELFWALHGGGGNFGVATSFTLRLYPLPAFSIALFLWPPEKGPEVARAYRDFASTAPNEVGGGFVYLTAPPEPFVPEEMVGTRACSVLVTYAGPEAGVRDLVEPFTTLEPSGQIVDDLPYVQLQSMLDDPPGFRNYWTAEYLGALPDPAIEAFCNRTADMVVPSGSQQVMFPQGGAVARGPSEYPVPWRRAPWAVHPFGLWEDPADDERAMRWGKGMRADLRPWSIGAVYLNFIGAEGEDRVIAGLGLENYQRLARVKARYDPDNVFHLNQNIKPR